MIINNHVLVPHLYNAAVSIPWSRRWQNEISTAVEGSETRSGFRNEARASISWTVTPTTLQDHQQLEQAANDAMKAGYGCAPYWARGQKLSADVTATAVSFSGLNWTFAVGDWVYFLGEDGVYNVRQFLTVAPYVLSAAVARTFGAGGLCWPIIFGKFSFKEVVAKTGHIGSIKMTISELVSPKVQQLGAVTPPAGTGISVWTIGSTFTIGGS